MIFARFCWSLGFIEDRKAASGNGLAEFGGLDGTWRNGGMLDFICDQGYPLCYFLSLIGVIHVARRDGHAGGFWVRV